MNKVIVRESWVSERIAGTAQVYEYNDDGVKFWIVACSREQADAVMLEHDAYAGEAVEYKVTVLDDDRLKTLTMNDEDDPSITRMFEAFVKYCNNYAQAGLLACTEY